MIKLNHIVLDKQVINLAAAQSRIMEKRLKIELSNHEICGCALSVTNSFMHRKQRRNGENDEHTEIILQNKTTLQEVSQEVSLQNRADRNADCPMPSMHSEWVSDL